MPESAADAFARHLAGGDSAALIQALDTAGDGAVAALLAACATARTVTLDTGWPAPWAGRPCVLADRPPADASAWSLWFDPVEVAVMTLLPRPSARYDSWPPDVQQRMTPSVGWLSVRRTCRWQVLGWQLTLGQRPEPDPATAVDDLAAPATGLTGRQAVQYVSYFGKSPAGPSDWTAVHEAGDPVAAALWPPSAGPELAGYVAEGEVLVQDREGALVAESDESPEDDAWRLAADSEPLVGVGFRTAVNSQLPYRGRPAPGRSAAEADAFRTTGSGR